MYGKPAQSHSVSQGLSHCNNGPHPCQLFHSYTCPFVEKFSIDIETYYKPDTGTKEDVFNLSSSDKRERTVGTEDPSHLLRDAE